MPRYSFFLHRCIRFQGCIRVKVEDSKGEGTLNEFHSALEESLVTEGTLWIAMKVLEVGGMFAVSGSGVRLNAMATFETD